MEKPIVCENEALIKVKMAGICGTDHGIAKGYIPNYKGVLGHEFIGDVTDCCIPMWVGRRVTAEINIGCGHCEFCKAGLQKHCVERNVLGIRNKNGVFSEYVTVPIENIVEIPEEISDREAIFIEPLAAALEVLKSVSIATNDKVLIVGDGRLALIIAKVLIRAVGCKLTIVGKHSEKLALLKKTNEVSTINTLLLDDFSNSFDKFNVVIEATGNPQGLALALKHVYPRGTIILKSTYGQSVYFEPSFVVVNEIRIVGSRCGSFISAIDFLKKYKTDFTYLISAEFALCDAIKAFEYSLRPDVIKVLLVF